MLRRGSRILGLAEHFPRVWHDPHLDAREHKRIRRPMRMTPNRRWASIMSSRSRSASAPWKREIAP
jgi:hypothetical protein